MSLENLTSPVYQDSKISEKWGFFNDITWKPELARTNEPRWEVSTKTRQFLHIHLKIWAAPVITSWNLRKYSLDFMMSFENLNYPYYHELKFSQK